MPKVSVIIPIFNVEQYLRECLESVINQTLRDIEIICVNDGSTDSSLSIIQEYALQDSRIKVINKINTGYGHSMNIGLDNATGEYIGIVESDDFASLEMFEKMYEVAKKNSSEVVKSNYFEYRNSLDIKETFIENLKGCKYNCVFSPLDEQNVFFVSPSIWSGIYKRSFLTTNNIRFNETAGASYQDTSFAFKVWASAERAYLIKDSYLYYRNDNMGSSVNSSSKIFCICDEYEEIERFLEFNNLKKLKLGQLEFSMKFRAYKWNYKRLSSPFQYAFLLKMIEEFKREEKSGMISTEYLTKLEVEELQYIIKYPHKYFKDTAKEYRDDRLMLSSTLNLKVYAQGFLAYIRQYENIIIFGAGIIGKIVAQELIKNKNSILCFAVSSMTQNKESLLDIEICSINNLIEYVDNSVILVSVKESDQYDVISKLKSLKFKNIISIDSLLLDGLNTKE